MEKSCSKCNICKPLSEFNKRSNSNDGVIYEGNLNKRKIHKNK